VELYPAIDLKQGRVVRVKRAEPDVEVLYHQDPLAVAQAWVRSGARWIHVVDLDRVFGPGDQTALIATLVSRLPVPVQVGGGFTDADSVAAMLDLGARRVVVGTRAAATKEGLAQLCDRFGPESLALALDVKHGRCWARGWKEAAAYTPLDLARRARAAGIRLVVHTDLGREGALSGANVGASATLAATADVGVLVSGGVSSLEDLAAIRDAGLEGAIVGRALFENRFTLEQALACSSSPS
jgi:phosphoribosylformimino-5-aminoimidazole carboxamide ribotide isomerase